MNKNSNRVVLCFAKKLFALLLLCVVVFFFILEVRAIENVKQTFYGMSGTPVIIDGISYKDINNESSWRSEAVYEASALGILKGYGNGYFGVGKVLTNEEAIASIYRMSGKQIKTKKNSNIAGLSEEAKKIWSFDYLQNAVSNGLITSQDLLDAFSSNPSPGTFYRKNPAKREDVAVWICKVLGLSVGNIPSFINGYKDFDDVDKTKLMYVDTVIKNGLMSGYNKNFMPKSPLTREQMAQIIVNSEGFIFKTNGFSKYSGTVIGISTKIDNTDENKGVIKQISLRNPDGTLNEIVLYSGKNSGYSGLDAVVGREKEVIVYKNGNLGSSSLLAKDDVIQYIVDKDMVKFIKVLPTDGKLVKIVGRLIDIPQNDNVITYKQFSHLPELIIENMDLFKKVEGEENLPEITSMLSGNVYISGLYGKNDKSALTKGLPIELELRNGVVESIKIADYREKSEDGVIKAVVEDNNPILNYISVYTLSGNEIENTSNINTYRYNDASKIQIIKNGKKAELKDIDEGDTVFLKFENSNIVSISASSNYSKKAGIVISKNENRLNVRFDDGTDSIIDCRKIPISKEGALIEISDVLEKDNVSILFSEVLGQVVPKAINVMSASPYISSVYKGVISNVDKMSGNIVFYNVQYIEKDSWVRNGHNGFNTYVISSSAEIYNGNNLLDINSLNNYYIGEEAYYVVENFKGEEKVVLVSLRDKSGREDIFSGDINNQITGSSIPINVSNQFQEFKVEQGTIVVKDGRLVYPGSLKMNDQVNIVANRGLTDQNYTAKVIVAKKPEYNNVNIFRGVISSINKNKNFTLETYSYYDYSQKKYIYYPNSKTFDLDFSTRIINSNGVVNSNDFNDLEDSSSVGKYVFVFSANEVKADVISFAEYGSNLFSGKVSELVKDSGQISKVKLSEVKQRDIGNGTDIQYSEKYMDIDISKDTVFIKKGNLIDNSEIKLESSISVIKSNTGNKAVVVFITGG